jgi:chromosome segregation ATPase
MIEDKTYKNNTNNYKDLTNKGLTAGHSNKDPRDYSYYSRVLKEPFETVEELKKAEEAYYAEIKAKEAKAAEKKADAAKVENAFKALNAARKIYKDDLAALTAQYQSKLEELKTSFKEGREKIYKAIAEAEEVYSAALKDFNSSHPEGYHVTLRDGDFETTISRSSCSNHYNDLFDLFDWVFKI